MRKRERDRENDTVGFCLLRFAVFLYIQVPPELGIQEKHLQGFFYFFFPIFIDPFAVENCFPDVPLFVSSVVEEPPPPAPRFFISFFVCCSVCCIFRLLLVSPHCS